jgi:hypothetical protein
MGRRTPLRQAKAVEAFQKQLTEVGVKALK